MDYEKLDSEVDTILNNLTSIEVANWLAFDKKTLVQGLIDENKKLILEKSLLNCHVKGMHSFILSEADGKFVRMFVTSPKHELWQNQCGLIRKEWDLLSLAIHPHHVDINMNVIYGQIWNIELKQKNQVEKTDFVLCEKTLQTFDWQSQIKTGAGGFKRIGDKTLCVTQYRLLDEFMSPKNMQSCELHTVFVQKHEISAWIITESEPSCGYDSLNYSNVNLEKWSPKGLYQKPTEKEIKDIFETINLKF